MPNRVNPWTTLNSERVYEDAFIALDRNEVRNASGRTTEYGVVRWKKRGVTVLPVDEAGCTFLVGQYRYAAARYTWELPAGGIEEGEDPLAGAFRELSEEIGVTGRSCCELLKVLVSGSLTDESGTGYAIWDLVPRRGQPDDSERIEVKRIPFSKAVELALNGGIADAVSVALLLAADARARRGDLPDTLLALLSSPLG